MKSQLVGGGYLVGKRNPLKVMPTTTKMSAKRIEHPMGKKVDGSEVPAVARKMPKKSYDHVKSKIVIGKTSGKVPGPDNIGDNPIIRSKRRS